MGPSLRDAQWRYGFRDQDIFNSVAEGRQHGMPAWGTKLPAEQIWKITAYIKSMGTKYEPKRPPPNPVFPYPPPYRDLPRTQERKGAD
jgi:mono/diheme cytochrome c family protein